MRLTLPWRRAEGEVIRALLLQNTGQARSPACAAGHGLAAPADCGKGCGKRLKAVRFRIWVCGKLLIGLLSWPGVAALQYVEREDSRGSPDAVP